MKINSHILSERLNGVHYKNIKSSPYQANLTHAMIYSTGMPVHTDCIYVMMEKDCYKITSAQSFTVVIIGNPPESLIDHPFCDLICCKKNLNILTLLSMIQSTLSLFYSWEERLINFLTEAGTIQDMCSASVEIFNNPLEVFGKNEEILAVGEADGIFCLDYTLRDSISDYPAEELYGEMISNRQFLNTYEHKAAIKLDLEEEEFGVCIIKNIFLDGYYWGRIVIDSVTKDCTDGDLYSVEVFAKYLVKYIQMNPHSIDDHKRQIKRELKNCLEGKAELNKKNSESILKQAGWTQKDVYQCVLIQCDFRADGIRSTKSECAYLETRVNNSIAIELERNIFLIKSLKNHQEVQSFKQVMTEIVGNRCLTAAFSTKFNCFEKLPLMYQQVNGILITGNKYDPMKWTYFFDDYITKFLLNNGLFSLSPLSIINSNFIHLIQYDVKHKTNYFETLNVYLEQNKNLVQAAELLAIHLSTLKYRVQKIKTMLEIDMDLNPEKELYLRLICQLIKELGKEEIDKLEKEFHSYGATCCY